MCSPILYITLGSSDLVSYAVRMALKGNNVDLTVEIVVLDPKIFLHVKFGHLNVF